MLFKCHRSSAIERKRRKAPHTERSRARAQPTLLPAACPELQRSLNKAALPLRVVTGPGCGRRCDHGPPRAVVAQLQLHAMHANVKSTRIRSAAHGDTTLARTATAARADSFPRKLYHLLLPAWRSAVVMFAYITTPRGSCGTRPPNGSSALCPHAAA